MPNFSINNISHEPDKPEGDELWLFRRIGTRETQLVPADTVDEAWKGIRFFKDGDWYAWVLVGREDIVDEDDDPAEVSAQFKQRNRVKVEKWEEADSGEDL